MPPQEYVIFSQERAFWKELGKRRDEMTMNEIADASLFMSLEAKHPPKAK